MEYQEKTKSTGQKSFGSALSAQMRDLRSCGIRENSGLSGVPKQDSSGKRTVMYEMRQASFGCEKRILQRLRKKEAQFRTGKKPLGLRRRSQEIDIPV